MNHKEVKQLAQELVMLVNHCVEKKVDIYHVNYGLDRNMTKLTSASEAISKNVSQELKDMEEKIWELAKKKDVENPVFSPELLSKKDKLQHEELFTKYLEFLEEPDDFEPYLLNPDKLEGLKIEFPFYQILKNFLPKED